MNKKNLTITLPCELGTKVWCVSEKGCISDLIGGCLGCYSMDNTGNCYEPGRIAIEKEFSIEMLNDFGKMVFLTKEEAEQAIEDMKESDEIC